MTEFTRHISPKTRRVFEFDEDGVPSRATLLDWLIEAENDLGDLARIVEELAASAGRDQSAGRARAIGHRWDYRRNKRRGRAEEATGEGLTTD
jgi:hypothetical protein